MAGIGERVERGRFPAKKSFGGGFGGGGYRLGVVKTHGIPSALGAK